MVTLFGVLTECDSKEAAKKPEATAPVPTGPSQEELQAQKGKMTAVALLAAFLALAGLGLVAPAEFVAHLTVFVLACFVGWQVVWSVTAALHTPLMSVTNAISGIIIVGGILQATAGASNWVLGMSVVAILIASINIFGGFLVTQRMLKMFRADTGSSKGGH